MRRTDPRRAGGLNDRRRKKAALKKRRPQKKTNNRRIIPPTPPIFALPTPNNVLGYSIPIPYPTPPNNNTKHHHHHRHHKKTIQILGAIFGALIYAGLIPGLSIAQKHFHGGLAPGCFGPAPAVTASELFGWESLMTMLLVLTVYAAAVTKPGHGNTAPLAIGLSLYAAALTGGPFTGASLNPARTIGPAVVFACNVRISFLYIASEMFGAALGAGLCIFLYGRAPVGRAAAAEGVVAGGGGGVVGERAAGLQRRQQQQQLGDQ